MIRGTTPVHTFALPVDESMIEKLRVIYAQNEKPIITKEKADCAIDGYTVRLTLSQEDTLKLNCNFPVEIYVRVVTKDGTAFASDPATDFVDDCGESEVL